jgi:acyl carrier protein
VDEQIKKVMARVFDIGEEKISEDSGPDDIEMWNSLSHMDLVMSLEAEFGLSFSPEEALDMISVKLIRLILEERAV